jgi:hypothetical protein
MSVILTARRGISLLVKVCLYTNLQPISKDVLSLVGLAQPPYGSIKSPPHVDKMYEHLEDASMLPHLSKLSHRVNDAFSTI